ncbi:hypothetical protein FOA52_004356 [Chlamydomonas sp. UWO 241]|nr:hypothetical protein FOA52_004356 [Chlamydomonas sp. UWO 241]
MASSAKETRAVLEALRHDPEVVVSVARGVLFRTCGLFKRWEKGWYSINHLGALVCSDGDDARDAKPVLDRIVAASVVQSEQSKCGVLMHAFQVKAANGDTRMLYCEDELCRDHWVLTVNEAVRRAGGGRPMQLADHYAIDYSSKLGSGLFAVVLRATDRKSGQSVAIKAIKPERFREHQSLILSEVSAWSAVGTHPRIVHLLGSFQSASRMYFACELCPGGGLVSSLSRNATYCEKDAEHIMRQVLEGLAHIHSRGVVHCDLKPENIIAMSKAKKTDIKIADFGLSAYMGRPMHVGGTPEFAAPELLRDPEYFMGAGVGAEVDMWSAGVLLYYLLSGTTPFFASSFDKIVAKVKDGTWTFKGPAWVEISASAKDLVKSLLCPVPDRRPSASQALAKPWVVREGSAPTKVGG